MAKRKSKTKGPRPVPDENQLAASLLRRVTEGDAKPDEAAEARSAAARILGAIGGRKGGRKRAENLTADELSAIGRKGAAARWGKGRRNRK